MAQMAQILENKELINADKLSSIIEEFPKPKLFQKEQESMFIFSLILFNSFSQEYLHL